MSPAPPRQPDTHPSPQAPGPSCRFGSALGALALSAALSGCDRAPSYSILGSFFPVWIFCFFAGVLLTFLLHLLLRRLGLDGQLTPPVLVYPSLAAFFTMALWLIFYS